MFLRAGFNPRHFRTAITARVARADRGWVRWAQLIRFDPSGEYAWYGDAGISWPHRLWFHTIHNDGRWHGHPMRFERPCSLWPRQEQQAA